MKKEYREEKRQVQKIDLKNADLRPIADADASEVFLYKGYEYIRPTAELLKALERYLAQEIKRAEYEVQVERRRILELEESINQASVEDDPKIPIVRRDCNQAVAWGTNTSLKPFPIFSVDPYTRTKYRVLTNDPVFGPVPMELESERIASSMELFLEKKFREDLGIDEAMYDVWFDCIFGRTPTWVKVYEKKQVKRVRVRDVEKGPKDGGQLYKLGVQTVEQEFTETRLEVLPYWAVLVPSDAKNEQSCAWVAEKDPKDPQEFDMALADGAFPLLTGDEEAIKVVRAATSNEVRDQFERESRYSGSMRYPTEQRDEHDIRQVWLTWRIKFRQVDMSTGKNEEWIEETPIVVDFHLGAEKALCLKRNPYDHQLRPLTPFWQRKKPHSFSGLSMAADIQPLERFVNQIIHLTIKNAIVANSTPLAIDPDSDALDWFADNPIGPASVIPVQKDEIYEIRWGRDYRSLMPEVQWLGVEIDKTSNQSAYEKGQTIPGRTAASTVSQILEQGLQQSVLDLRTIGRQWAKVAKMWLKTYRQFHPYGEEFAYEDEDGEIIKAAFRLPSGDVLDEFRIALTAADENLAKEADIEHLVMVAQMLDQDSQLLAQMLAAVVDGAATPNMRNAVLRMVERKQAVIEEIIEKSRRDAKRFTLDDEILQGLKQDAEQLAMQMQMQQQMMAAQGGDPNEGQVAPPGAAGQAPV